MLVSDKFRSKRDLWLGVVILLPALAGIVLLFTPAAFASIPMLGLGLFMVPTWFKTYYTISSEDDSLIINTGLTYKKRFRISEITGIKKTSNVMSATALSLDRLEIRFQNKQYVLVSPRDQEAFIARLLSVNPKIAI